jgi:hypothetical protein
MGEEEQSANVAVSVRKTETTLEFRAFLGVTYSVLAPFIISQLNKIHD